MYQDVLQNEGQSNTKGNSSSAFLQFSTHSLISVLHYIQLYGENTILCIIIIIIIIMLYSAGYTINEYMYR